MTVEAPRRLDEHGRCCGRKPLVYKRDHGLNYPAGHFCVRCDRAYDAATGVQIPNWAFVQVDVGFVARWLT